MDNKLALLTLEYPPHTGGVARMYEQLVNSVSGNMDVYVQRPSDLVRNDRVTYVSFFRISMWPKWWPSVRLVRNIWKTGKYHSLVVGHVLPLGTAARIASYFIKLRYDVVVHGMDVYVPLQDTKKKIVLKWVLRGAHGVIAANQHVANAVMGLGVPSNRVHVVYPNPGILDFKHEATVSQLAESYGLNNGPVLLTVARLVERKGIQFVLDALDSIWQVYPNLNYVIVGKGPYEQELKKHIAELSRDKQVHLLTNQTDNEIASWYDMADIFVMTPITMDNGDCEGLGIVYLEAALHGKPSIGTRHGGVPEAILDNETGVLVSEKNSAEIASAVLGLLDDSVRLQDLGRSAERRVKELFTQERQAHQFKTAVYD